MNFSIIVENWQKLIWSVTIVFFICVMSIVFICDIFPQQIFQITIAGFTYILGFLIITYSISSRVSNYAKESNIQSTYLNAFKLTQIMWGIALIVFIASLLLDKYIVGRYFIDIQILIINGVLGLAWAISIICCLYYLYQCFEKIWFIRPGNLLQEICVPQNKSGSTSESEILNDKQNVAGQFNNTRSNFKQAMKTRNKMSSEQKKKSTMHFIFLFTVLLTCTFVVSVGHIIPPLVFEITILGVVNLIGFILATYAIATSIISKKDYGLDLEKLLAHEFRYAFYFTCYALLYSFLLILIFSLLDYTSKIFPWAGNLSFFGISGIFTIRFVFTLIWIASIGMSVGKLNQCFNILIILRCAMTNTDPADLVTVQKKSELKGC